MSRQAFPYVLFILSILTIAGMGYGLYLIYPRFDLPLVMGFPLVVLAGGAGLASFFSPCSFPLLLTFLARETGEGGRARSPWTFASGLSMGAACFLTLLGGFFLAGGLALSKAVTFGSVPGIVLRFLVGAVLVWLGGVQIGWASDRLFRWIQQRVSPGPEENDPRWRYLNLVGYGFGYVLAGFG